MTITPPRMSEACTVRVIRAGAKYVNSKDNIMDIRILILILCMSSTAFAGGKPTPPPPPPITTAMAQADAVSASNSAAASDANAVSASTSTSGDSTSKATSSSGDSSSKSTSNTGASSAILNNSIPKHQKIRIENNAATALGAPYINGLCWVGGAGAVSGSQGSISLFPAKRDPLCLALAQFELLVNIGLPGPAAKVYCGEFRTLVLRRKYGFWKPFGSVEQCEAGIFAALEASVVTDSIVVTIDVDEAEQTCTTTGENVRIELQDAEGVMRIYDCEELRGKMSGAEYE